MKIQVLDKETELKVTEIQNKIKLRKNGICSDAMQKAGIVYELNYGASIPHLREIAREYTPCNMLAQALWSIPWRETMIVATLLYDVQNMDLHVLDHMASTAFTEELYQQIGMNIVSHLDDGGEVIKQFIASGKLSKKVIACYAITKWCTANAAASAIANDVSKLLLSTPLVGENNRVEINALAKALGRAGYISNTENADILAFFANKIDEHAYWKVAYDMVKTEFEYR